VLKGGEKTMSNAEKDANDLVAQALNVAELIDYQEGSVVSRTVIDKAAGTITVFSFDKGQGLSEHTAPFDAFVYILDGKAEISISGKPNTVENGQMIIMPANEPHALSAVEKFKMLLVMIRS
jgi:quercetin dioxygenase-like cupin family protein